MGAVACDLADVVIVTSDNPRSEDPEAIIAAILEGRRRRAWRSSVDRRAAIERAIGIAEPGDIVVIAGKGHEQGQEFEDGRKVPFDDVARRPGGAACATGRLTASPRRRARAWSRRRRTPPGPGRVVIDSREVGAGDLFVGLPGEQRRRRALRAAGARGRRVGRPRRRPSTPTPPAARRPARCSPPTTRSPRSAASRPPGAASLGAQVVGITGSTGKTSTKDLLAGMLAPHRRVVATAQNLNTEIGLPLTVLGAPAGTEVLVLEMAMRGAGQIAELAAIAEPDVGVIVNVGPVHLELLGSIEAIAATKAELIAALQPGGTAVVPAGEPLLEPHRRGDVTTVTFGPGGDVAALPRRPRASRSPPPTCARNALAALAAARAVGVEPAGGRRGRAVRACAVSGSRSRTASSS